MDKKYYWIIDGKYYEVSKSTYQKFKKEYDRSKLLEKHENEVVLLSLDALVTEDTCGYDVIADTSVNVEDEAIKNIMLEKLRLALSKLSADDLVLIDLLFTQLKSEREISSLTGIPQKTINNRKKRLLETLRNEIDEKS